MQFRFSLRMLCGTLLVATLIFGACSQRTRRQQQLVKSLEGVGFQFTYDLEETAHNLWFATSRKWLGERIGLDWVGSPCAAIASRKEVDCDDVNRLCRLHTLQSLNLSGTNITDQCLVELLSLPVLEELILRDTLVSDAGLATLAQAKQLRLLDVDLSLVSHSAAKEFRAGHPSCAIKWRFPMARPVEIRRRFGTTQPVAIADEDHFTAKDTELVVSEKASGVMHNDYDEDYDAITAKLMRKPQHGELVRFQPDGTFTYRPQNGFVGTDTFEYQVHDGKVSSDPATVIISVIEPKSQPEIKVSNSSMAEGDPLSFNIELSAVSVNTVTVEYATTDGTATAGADYAPLGKSLLTFRPGETWKQVVVETVRDSDADEEHETLTLNLSNPTNATIAEGQGVGNVLNLSPPPEIAITRFYSDGVDWKIDYTVSGDFDLPYRIGVFAAIDDHVISDKFVEGAGITTPGTHTLKLPATLDDTFADFWLEAIVDIDGEVQETNEDNDSLVFEGGAFLARQSIDGKRVLHVHGTHSDDVTEIVAVDSRTIEVRVTAGLPLPTDPRTSPRLYVDVTGDDRFTAIDAQAVAFNLASSTALWHNASNRLDVNNDGAVSPLDALRIVDHLHNWGTKLLNTAPTTTDNYLDVSRDNVLSKLDLEIVLRAMHSDPHSLVDPESAAGHAWRNASNPLDVNADGRADADDQTAINNALTLAAMPSHQYDLDKIDVVHIRMQRGDDEVRIDPSLNVPAWLYGGDGSDLVATAGADDQLLGGTGTDFLFGGAGSDKLYGGSDDDWLLDLSGDNLLEGGPGKDWYNDSPSNPAAGTVVAELQDIYRGAEDEREWQLHLGDALAEFRMRHAGPYDYDVTFSGADIVSKSWIADEILHIRFVAASPGITTATVRVTAVDGHKESRTIRIYSVAVTGFTAERKIGPDEWIVDDGPQWASDEVRYQVEFTPTLPDLELVVRWLYVPVGQHHLPDNDWEEIGRGDTSRPVQLHLPAGLGAITPELLLPEIEKTIEPRQE